MIKNPSAAVPPAGGLVLRPARPTDLDQIGALLTARGEPDDAVDHRLVVTDPDAGLSACTVVVDGDRVVSTATLLDEELCIGGIRLPAGQVELVATDAEYEGRGLVRALMDWAHARSAARGHLVQAMIGIPYFYRLFGYEYAIDITAGAGRGHPAARRRVRDAPAYRAAFRHRLHGRPAGLGTERLRCDHGALGGVLAVAPGPRVEQSHGAGAGRRGRRHRAHHTPR
ncbi:GNAT family N-acetyltransferase [Streptomyces sp. NPDC056254]|uniref:GNAT family N-acetyltransferase n=1 Tax=Streptomyces sp. NPDC056254 TaxID=3345763 RepID=UPI0035D85E28